MAKLYYQEFKTDGGRPNQAAAHCYHLQLWSQRSGNRWHSDEENPEDTSNLDQSSRDFLDAAIQDYNEMFHTNYSTDGERFQNYYKDVSLRMKIKSLTC